jgi:hypothetical protein
MKDSTQAAKYDPTMIVRFRIRFAAVRFVDPNFQKASAITSAMLHPNQSLCLANSPVSSHARAKQR